jgi:hypothetical protein
MRTVNKLFWIQVWGAYLEMDLVIQNKIVNRSLFMHYQMLKE